jgi:hypothetical protein
MSKQSVTIRMGAAHWDAEVNGVSYDFRTMTTDQRKGWYGAFMGSVRRFLRGGKPSSNRRSKVGSRRRRGRR